MSSDDSSKTTSKPDNHGKEAKSSDFVGVGKKLGIAVPAGLMLLANITVNAAVAPQSSMAGVKNAADLEKLQSNEVAGQLFDYATRGTELASASNCNGLHGDNHVNKNSPDVTDNNGKHGNVHSDQHGDSCRY